MPVPAGVEIRAATDNDMPLVTQINAHYVKNTVVTFVEEPPEVDEILSKFLSVAAEGLPYIVAVPRRGLDPDASDSDIEEQKGAAEAAEVLGYAYVKGFRGMKGAYRHTVELSLFCHPNHQGKGIGTALLQALLAALREPKKHGRFFTAGHPPDPPREIRHVVSVMAVDVQGRGGGLALKEFYESFGFVMRGHLKEVGYKLGRWVDTMYLQLTLQEPAVDV